MGIDISWRGEESGRLLDGVLGGNDSGQEEYVGGAQVPSLQRRISRFIQDDTFLCAHAHHVASSPSFLALAGQNRKPRRLQPRYPQAYTFSPAGGQGFTGACLIAENFGVLS